MSVFVVILNFNGKHDTLECLESLKLLKTDDIKLQTIVVDNASVDDSVKQIKKRFPQIILLVNQRNLGFAGGNNVGIKYALKKGADFVWLINNDTTIGGNCLMELLSSAAEKKNGGVFGPKIYFQSGFETHKERYKSTELGKVIWYAGGRMDWKNVLASHRGVDEVDRGKYDILAKTDFVSGCSMLIRREVLETIGILDEKYYLYYEDLDFCKKAQKKGYNSYYVPQAIMWHKNAESSGGPGSDLQSYYITRNRLLIGMRYAPWKTKLALFREAVNLVMHGSLTQKHAVGDFIRKKFGKRMKGSRLMNMSKFPPKINLFGARRTQKK